MEFIETLIGKLSISDYGVGSEHWVDVTHINTPHSFYVRPTLCRRYMSVLHAYDDKPLPADLHLGSVIIYESTMLQSFVRGRIVFIQGQDLSFSCDLFALDYGCVEKAVPLDNLRKPLHSINVVPPLAIHCQLADCHPIADTWNDDVIECMKCFIGTERARMIVRDKCSHSFMVELYNSCPEDIATMLSHNGHTTSGYSGDVGNKESMNADKHSFKYKEHAVGETLTVRVMAGDSLKSFFVARMEDYKLYLRERDCLTFYCKKQKHLELLDVSVGMSVAAYMITQNIYERAIVTKVIVPNETVEVMLVDWGRLMEIPINRLTRMAEKFFRPPAIAVYCSVEDVYAWDTALLKYLYPGHKFKITVLKSGDKFDVPHIVKICPCLEG